MRELMPTYIEGFVIQPSSAGYYIVDYDMEGYETNYYGPYKTRRKAENKALILAYPHNL